MSFPARCSPECEGRVAIIVDDLIGSGATLVRTAAACRAAGTMRVIALAPIACPRAAPVLFGWDGPDGIIIGDRVPVSMSLGRRAAPVDRLCHHRSCRRHHRVTCGTASDLLR